MAWTAPGPGRPKGAVNKVTRELRAAVIRAAELEGGEEGLVGYLRHLAREVPTAFAPLLGKIIPSELASHDRAPLSDEDLQLLLEALRERKRLEAPMLEARVIEGDTVQ